MAGRRVAVIGASGYGGMQTLRLLQGHPHLTVSFLGGERSSGRRWSELVPFLPLQDDLVVRSPDPEAIAAAADLAVLSLPNGLAAQAGAPAPGARCEGGGPLRRLPLPLPGALGGGLRRRGPPVPASGRRSLPGGGLRPGGVRPGEHPQGPSGGGTRLFPHRQPAGPAAVPRTGPDRDRRHHHRCQDRHLRRWPRGPGEPAAGRSGRSRRSLRGGGPSPHQRDRAAGGPGGRRTHPAAVHSPPDADGARSARHGLRTAAGPRASPPTTAPLC